MTDATKAGNVAVKGPIIGALLIVLIKVTKILIKINYKLIHVKLKTLVYHLSDGITKKIIVSNI